MSSAQQSHLQQAELYTLTAHEDLLMQPKTSTLEHALDSHANEGAHFLIALPLHLCTLACIKPVNCQIAVGNLWVST